LLIPDTIRIFRLDLRCLIWILVATSGVSLTRDFAWAEVHRPGTYVAIGLPRDPGTLRRIADLYSLRPLLHALGDDERTAFARRLFEDDHVDDMLARFPDDPDLGPVFEARKAPVGSGGGRRRTRGLQAPAGPQLPEDFELPQTGLPEFDILDDICPPWRGPHQLERPKPLDLVDIFRPGLIFFRPDWVSAGPVNFSGRIKSLAVHPSNSNTVYAGAADGGVWKTTNAGASWQAKMVTELSMAIGGLAIAPSNPNVIYAATGEDTPGWGPSYPGVGVYRSTDAGQTWTLTTGVGDRCSKVAVDPWNADVAYVASNWGVYKTVNGGGAWTRVLAGYATDVLVDPFNPTRLFAALWDDGIYVSTDSGTSWNRSGLGIPILLKGWAIFWIGRLPTGTDAGWIKLAMGRNGASGTSFLAAKMGPDSGTIYTTSDGGFSWFALAGSHQAASYNEWTNMVAINPNNHDILFAGGVGVERSTNGSTFAAVGGTHSDHQAFDFDRQNPAVCYMATDGGVYRSSDNGANWTLRVTNLTATQFYSVGVSQSGAFIVGGATQDQGILASTGSSTWVDTGAGNEGGIFVVDPNDSHNLYTTPWSNNLRRSRNSGSTWQDIRNGMTQSVGGVTTPPANVAHIAVRPGTSATLVAVGVIANDTGYRSSRIFRSTNQGDNWTSRATVTGDGTRVAFSDLHDDVCYVTTTDGRVYRSANGGSSWAEPYAAGAKPSNNALSALAVDRHDEDVLYIGCSGYGGARVLRSLDGGATWTNVSGSGPGALPNLPVNCLVLDECDYDKVYLANDIGVFRTTDGGVSWHDFSDGFLFWDVPRIIVTELALRRSTNTLYASTMGRGIFRRAV
jgi:hypothetical protein